MYILSGDKTFISNNFYSIDPVKSKFDLLPLCALIRLRDVDRVTRNSEFFEMQFY